jgi:chromosome segregation ATPase
LTLKGNRLLTKYVDRNNDLQEELQGCNIQITKLQRKLQECNVQITNLQYDNRELKGSNESLKNELIKVQQDLLEYEELTKQWENFTDQSTKIEEQMNSLQINQPIEFTPLTPGTQELLDGVMNFETTPMTPQSQELLENTIKNLGTEEMNNNILWENIINEYNKKIE